MTKRKRDEELRPPQASSDVLVESKTITSSPGTESNTNVENLNGGEDGVLDVDNTLRRKSHRISQKRSMFTGQTSNVASNESYCLDKNASTEAIVYTKQSPPKEGQDTPSTSASNAQPNKTLRKVQAWTEDDTRWFFEALCEHGKDFPSVQSYIAARCEKKAIPVDLIKTYEQVRHYYYRMWHKISPLLNISDDVEKNVQELYGIINYGEIWKKFGTKLDSRLRDTLQHLVYSGHTVCKFKGKTVRVRTPVCNALKRLHKLDVGKSVAKASQVVGGHTMPKEIVLQIIPASNGDWWTVHNLAHNPRLQTCLAPQTRLVTLIDYLERRWSLARMKRIESSELLGEDVTQPQPSNQRRLLLRPAGSMKLCEKMLLKSTGGSGGQQVLVSDISLNAYIKNDHSKMHKKLKKKKRGKVIDKDPGGMDDKAPEQEQHEVKLEDSKEQQQTSPSKDNNQVGDILKMLDSMNEELEQTVVKPNNDHQEESDLVEKVTSTPNLHSKQAQSSLNEFKLPEPPSNATLGQWLAGETAEKEDNAEEDKHNEGENGKSKNSRGKKRRASSSGSEETIALLTADKAKAGWTAADASSISMGELYLLFGHPDKIVLEYEWVEECPNQDDQSAKQESTTFLQKFLLAANLCLNNYTKKSAPSNASSSNSSMKTKRISKNVPKNSELLSSLIKETILSEATKDGNEMKTTTTSQTKPRTAPASKATVAQIISDDQQNEFEREINNLKTHNNTRRQVRRSISRSSAFQMPLPPAQPSAHNGRQKVYLQILTPEGQKKNIQLVQSASISIASTGGDGASVSGSSVVIPIQVDPKELFSSSTVSNANETPTFSNLQSNQETNVATMPSIERLMRDENSFDISQFANADWLNDVQNISISSLIGMTTSNHEEMVPPQLNMMTEDNDVHVNTMANELNFARFAEQIKQTSNHQMS